MSGAQVLSYSHSILEVRFNNLEDISIPDLLEFIDTPWDEPSDQSPEYTAYLNGTIHDVSPWDRIRGEQQGLHWVVVKLDCFVATINLFVHRRTYTSTSRS
jgi:hypothetical protein